MAAGDMTDVTIPIAPQIEHGTITVKIKIQSQIARQDIAIDIDIAVNQLYNISLAYTNWPFFEQPEGVTINNPTSLMLDLKNRAHVLRFLDIQVEETPVIPYSKYRRYIFGSPSASVTLCGKS